jgi:hypothetical protein
LSNASELAETFRATNSEFLKVVEGLTNEQWRTPCPDVGWPVGVTAHHVAESLGTLTGLVQAVAAGAAVPPITAEALDQGNAEHATRAANATRAETTKLLQDGIAAGTEMIRSLNAEQLQKTAALPMGQMTNEQIVQLIMIGHTGIHSAGIKAATA